VYKKKQGTLTNLQNDGKRKLL